VGERLGQCFLASSAGAAAGGGGPGGGDPAEGLDELTPWLRGVVAELAGVPSIAVDDAAPFDSFGVDSLAQVDHRGDCLCVPPFLDC
jgi:hypothetical protein